MNYIKGFNGLRAISILFVLSGHLGLFQLIEGIPVLKDNYNLFSGSSGVMIFFSISGFLITSLLLTEKQRKGRINFKYFFIRRFLRLAPPLLLFLITISILMYFQLLSPSYPAVVISFFYLYNFVPFNYYTDELAHTWSLGVEEQFYLFWPFVIGYVSKIKNGLIFAFLIVLLCIYGKPLLTQPITYNGAEHYLSNWFFIDRWFIPACLPIMIGSITRMIMFGWKEKIEHFLKNNYWAPILSLLLYTAQIFIPHLSISLISVLQPIGVSSFLLWIYFNQNNLFVNALELKPIAFLGKISYGVYVYQGLFLRNGPGGKLAIQHFPLNVILLFVTAILSYFLIEKRIMNFKNKFKPN